MRPAGRGRGVDDGHGIGGYEFATAVVGVAERRGKLRGLVEPEDPEEELGGGSVPADFEDVGGPEGGVGEVVPGDDDGVVHAAIFVADWVDVGAGMRGGEDTGRYVLTHCLKRSRVSQIAVGRTT